MAGAGAGAGAGVVLSSAPDTLNRAYYLDYLIFLLDALNRTYYSIYISYLTF
jgi:hypothetical protein